MRSAARKSARGCRLKSAEHGAVPVGEHLAIALHRRAEWLEVVVAAIGLSLGAGCSDGSHEGTILAATELRHVIRVVSVGDLAPTAAVDGGRVAEGSDAAREAADQARGAEIVEAGTDATTSATTRQSQCVEGAYRDCLVYRDNPNSPRGYRYCERGLQTCKSGGWGACTLSGDAADSEP